MTPEQLAAGMELNSKLETARGYDDYEAHNGRLLGYEPNYSFGLAGLAGMNNNTGGLRADGKVPHFGDAGKLPGHPTFSDQALLHSMQNVGGRWDEANMNHGDVFYPSTQQLDQKGYLDKLQETFVFEKGNGIDDVVVPDGYRNIDKEIDVNDYIEMKRRGK